jgi:CheY-like chemotaxis protein
LDDPGNPTLFDALVGVRNRARREHIDQMLRRNGCAVKTTPDGFHLIQRLADAILSNRDIARPDLIIADAVLPGCTGASLLAGLRDLGWETPVILLTMDGGPRSWPQHIRGLLAMPIDMNELEQVIRLALGHRGRGHRRQRHAI